MIVTIDGPAGSGKSTAARQLAARLGFRFLDTGAMYRAVALECVTRGVPPESEEAVAAIADRVRIELPAERVLVDGRDVTEAIRSPEATAAASYVAVHPEVRRALVRLQREAAAGGNVVSEGRDQGTVVFPDAECKFFLTADAEERARRRWAEFRAQGSEVSFEELLTSIRDRDERDEQRAVAPLKPAADATVIDTSHRTIEEVLAELERVVRDHRESIERASRDRSVP
ncbi:MAG: (d)CMP kinase [Planctomycetaceae bacterium]